MNNSSRTLVGYTSSIRFRPFRSLFSTGFGSNDPSYALATSTAPQDAASVVRGLTAPGLGQQAFALNVPSYLSSNLELPIPPPLSFPSTSTHPPAPSTSLHGRSSSTGQFGKGRKNAGTSRSSSTSSRPAPRPLSTSLDTVPASVDILKRALSSHIPRDSIGTGKRNSSASTTATILEFTGKHTMSVVLLPLQIDKLDQYDIWQGMNKGWRPPLQNVVQLKSPRSNGGEEPMDTPERFQSLLFTRVPYLAETAVKASLPLSTLLSGDFLKIISFKGTKSEGRLEVDGSRVSASRASMRLTRFKTGEPNYLFLTVAPQWYHLLPQEACERFTESDFLRKTSKRSRSLSGSPSVDESDSDNDISTARPAHKQSKSTSRATREHSEVSELDVTGDDELVKALTSHSPESIERYNRLNRDQPLFNNASDSDQDEDMNSHLSTRPVVPPLSRPGSSSQHPAPLGHRLPRSGLPGTSNSVDAPLDAPAASTSTLTTSTGSLSATSSTPVPTSSSTSRTPSFQTPSTFIAPTSAEIRKACADYVHVLYEWYETNKLSYPSSRIDVRKFNLSTTVRTSLKYNLEVANQIGQQLLDAVIANPQAAFAKLYFVTERGIDNDGITGTNLPALLRVIYSQEAECFTHYGGITVPARLHPLETENAALATRVGIFAGKVLLDLQELDPAFPAFILKVHRYIEEFGETATLPTSLLDEFETGILHFDEDASFLRSFVLFIKDPENQGRSPQSCENLQSHVVEKQKYLWRWFYNSKVPSHDDHDGRALLLTRLVLSELYSPNLVLIEALDQGFKMSGVEWIFAKKGDRREYPECFKQESIQTIRMLVQEDKAHADHKILGQDADPIDFLSSTFNGKLSSAELATFLKRLYFVTDYDNVFMLAPYFRSPISPAEKERTVDYWMQMFKTPKLQALVFGFCFRSPTRHFYDTTPTINLLPARTSTVEPLYSCRKTCSDVCAVASAAADDTYETYKSAAVAMMSTKLDVLDYIDPKLNADQLVAAVTTNEGNPS